MSVVLIPKNWLFLLKQPSHTIMMSQNNINLFSWPADLLCCYCFQIIGEGTNNRRIRKMFHRNLLKVIESQVQGILK